MAAGAVVGVECGEPRHAGGVGGSDTALYALPPRHSLPYPAGVGHSLYPRGQNTIQSSKAQLIFFKA